MPDDDEVLTPERREELERQRPLYPGDDGTQPIEQVLADMRELGNAEFAATTIIKMPKFEMPAHLVESDKRFGESIEAENARENAKRAAAKNARAETASVKRADGDDDEDLGITPWTDDDLEELSRVGPEDVPAALAATSPKLRSLNTARPDDNHVLN